MFKNRFFKFARLTALAAGVALAGLTAAATEPAPIGEAKAPLALTTVAALDVPRYMGTWYEIAKFPNWFQRKCASSTRAEYRLMPAGTVQVINRCQTAGGETISAEGLARRIGPANSPKLEVRFAPAWLSFVPLVWGDYWVIDLDADYQLAAVSEPKRNYLWVLSRTPKVDPVAYKNLLERLRAKGFDLSPLEVTPQN